MKSRIGAIVNVALGCMAALLASPALADTEINCANATATAELNACADRELQAADKELNAVYRSALAAVPSLAAEKPMTPRAGKRPCAPASAHGLDIATRSARVISPCSGRVAQAQAPTFWAVKPL